MYRDVQSVFTLLPYQSASVDVLLNSGGSAEPVQDLNRVCIDKQVHLILGEVHDAIPGEVQDALVDPKSGRKFASVTRLKNVGHLVGVLLVAVRPVAYGSL